MKSGRDIATCAIGDAAARYGLATSVLRHWDAAGVLHPSGRVKGQRRYTVGDVYRTGVVLFCKEAGLSLEEIRQLLSTRGSNSRRTMLRRKLAELDERIVRAADAKRMVQEVMYCSATNPIACPRFRATIDARRR